MAIGAAKSVSFKKIDSVRFKISFKKVLKLKKNQIRLELLLVAFLKMDQIKCLGSHC